MPKPEFERGAKIVRWEGRLDDPQAALDQIGALLVAQAQQAFRDQSLGDEKWEERSSPNVYGIIADLAAGKTPPARRFEGRPALKDTGRMASTITHRIVGTHTVEAGSNLPYSGRLNAGGPIESKTITSEMQSLLWGWLKGQGSAHRSTLGWLLSKKFRGTKLAGKVVARPFVGITEQLIEDVKEEIGVTILEAGK